MDEDSRIILMIKNEEEYNGQIPFKRRLWTIWKSIFAPEDIWRRAVKETKRSLLKQLGHTYEID